MATREEIHDVLGNVELTAGVRQTESGWWIAHCREVPEARTQGETKDEAMVNLKDAVAFILEDCSLEELQEFRAELVAEERELLAL